MKAVLISIQPKWCEPIASVKKTVEVRKTRPKLETPFKCYIYCTKVFENNVSYSYKTWAGYGKVIGEFVCREVEEVLDPNITKDFFESCDIGKEEYTSLKEIYAEQCQNACLSPNELSEYLNYKDGYGWHISNLVIYDNPKELSEFKTFCKSYYDGNKCDDCKYFIDGRGYDYDESDCGCNGLKPIGRPPQSWCYVESEVED